MNLSKLTQNIGALIRLKPGTHDLDAVGDPPSPDLWRLEAIDSKNSLSLVRLYDGSRLSLSQDQVHHFDTSVDTGESSPCGYLILNVQLVAYEGEFTFLSSKQPGFPVFPNVATRTVHLSYPADSGLQDELLAKGFEVRWSKSTRVSNRIAEGWRIIYFHCHDRTVFSKYSVHDPSDDLILMKKGR